MEPAARLAQIEPRITQIARRYHGAAGLTQDDYKQHIYLKLIERCQIDPAFLDRPDPQLIKFADWRARNLLESTTLYSDYVGEETYSTDEDGDSESDFEWIADPGPTPETSVILRERAAIIDITARSLGERRHTICRMLADGYTEAEIARRLGVSRAAVNQQKTIIRQALAQALSD